MIFIAGILLGAGIVFSVMFWKQKSQVNQQVQSLNQQISEMIPQDKVAQLEKNAQEDQLHQSRKIENLEQDLTTKKHLLEEFLEILNSTMKDLQTKNEEVSLNESITLIEHVIDDVAQLFGLVSTFERWHDGMNKIKHSINAMHKLNDEFNRIGRRIGILSMNARIEAAKAGDAEKGFTIVAEEFSKLAKHTKILCDSHVKELNNNDLLITTTFQDTQAGSRMVLTAIDSVKITTNDLKNSITQKDEFSKENHSMLQEFTSELNNAQIQIENSIN
ncbi:MAG: methyl-accepting chemotaxis protein [bacterium]|jgi:methyl-accepting chemotaxis protein